MTIKTTTKIIAISLRRYAGNHNPNLEPDVLGELEIGFAADHATEPGSNYLLATDAEVADLLDWWTDEANNANKGIDGDALAGLTADELADDVRWVLDTQEIKE